MNQLTPVFIIGPGRSGSTLLYKVLSLHSEVGFISNYDTRFPRVLPTPALSRLAHYFSGLKMKAWFGQDGGAYLSNRSLLRKFIPSPVEGEEIYRRAGVDSPECVAEFSGQVNLDLRDEFIRLQTLQRARILLLKRIANNRRLAALSKAFPEAKYIYLVRDGRSVAYSLPRVNWWSDHKVWWKDGLTPRELAAKGDDMLALAAQNWTEALRSLELDLKCIPNDKVLNVRYEELLEKPMETCKDVLSFMGVNSSPEYESTIGQLGLKSRTEAWIDGWREDELATVMKIQQADLKKLGYV